MTGTLLGTGNTADVYDIGDNKALKLFHAGYSQGSVAREFENSQLLNQLDIPVARSYEMVMQDGRYGIIYKKINGKSLLDIIFKTCDIEKFASILASVHKDFLGNSLPSAISYKSILQKNIEDTNLLSAKRKSKVLGILCELPDCDGLCHGDFHFGNLLIEQQKIYVIDFMNICKGHKFFDIARTIYLTELTPVPTDMPNQKMILELKQKATDIYLEKMGVNRENLSDWLTVIAAARLSELRSGQTAETNAVIQYLSLHGV